MTISETIVETRGISRASFLQRRMEKQLHLRHVTKVEKPEQTVLLEFLYGLPAIGWWLSVGPSSSTGAVFCCYRSWCCSMLVGHGLVKGCRLPSWLQNSDFLLPAPLVASFFLSTVCDSPVLPSPGKVSRRRTAVSASAAVFCGEDVAAIPSMGTDSLQSTYLVPVGGVGPRIVGLGLRDLGLALGCPAERPWLLSYTLSPKAFLLPFLTFLPLGILHFPFWLEEDPQIISLMGK